MQAKKKKKKTIISRTTQPRTVRLQRAKAWLETYEGKNLVRGYAKKYRVDMLCAIQELKLLGVEIKAEYEQAVRQTISHRMGQNQQKQEAKETGTEFDGISQYQDWDFAFILGVPAVSQPCCCSSNLK